ncbi:MULTISPECIES: tetracycline resistance MFS efflux pump [unclassified Leisingera]|uniref:tetracycline resistance MFS efflux pump n=1 Tax=unclassified Leisingera TaxID=2614906 RepID=UPI00030A52BB|nr:MULTISPECIES: tetracycline resistance MFS efflux pump [unclassified Leisingera]KIC23474.1 tetracycline resistance protein [Leisingera sp. ANG-S3]KIC54955.1 tetracycline resistance protein [Leisingera sp. ANG-S]KID08652.1 tetracycline resistance protein [Leisingera sp. ANG1]
MFKNRAITFILITLMIDAIGIGIVFPIMPDLMNRVGAGGTGQGAFWGGLLMAAYSGALFLCGPVVGSISDSAGRRPVLIAALAMLALDYVIMALAGSFWLLLLGRTLAGLAGATYITATAYIADISSPQEKAANFGLIGAAFGIGFVLGPAIGGLAAEISLAAPFWIAAGLSAANALFGILVLPESLAPDKRRPFGKRDLNPFKSIFDAFRLPGLAVPLLCIFMFEFANMVYPTIWAFWTREVFGWPTLYIGLSLAAYGVLLALVQGGLLPNLIRWFGDFPTLMLGMASALIGMIGFGFTGSIAGLTVFLVLAALSDLVPALMTAMASNQTDEDRQGVVQGVIASLSSVAAILSPLAMTSLFQASVDADGLYLPGAPFLFAAVLVIAMMPLAVRLKGHAST